MDFIKLLVSVVCSAVVNRERGDGGRPLLPADDGALWYNRCVWKNDNLNKRFNALYRKQAWVHFDFHRCVIPQRGLTFGGKNVK